MALRDAAKGLDPAPMIPHDDEEDEELADDEEDLDDDEPADDDADPDADPPVRKRRRLERILPDLLKRGIEAGIAGFGRSDEAIRALLGDRKITKELTHVLLSQIDETKNGLFRAVAHEVRDFLEATDIASEIKKALTSLSFEVKMEVRFIPNDKAEGGVKPDVKSDVKVRRMRPAKGE